MQKFKVVSTYKQTQDQKKASDMLSHNFEAGNKHQVLLGVTGSGKTFTIANVIQNLQKPALVISHNKTLAAQLYQEFRDFFPENAVSYFVSYYDYYQPEAYIPQTDTYIEKDADINETIDKLRLQTTSNLLTRNDTIVVASVSCIYNIGSPVEYGNFVLLLEEGQSFDRKELTDHLIDLQYDRGDFGFHRGTFRLTGDIVDIYPAYEDIGIRVLSDKGKVTRVIRFDPLTGKEDDSESGRITKYLLYPAKHFITDPDKQRDAFAQIRKDAKERTDFFKKRGKFLEANRISQKVNYDLEMIEQLGYVKGIENYSRYFDGRSPGDAPYSLLDYFKHAFTDDWLVFIDESHITFPQIRGMYAGDLSRKKVLIDYGFRLPASLDNRPLTFEEFLRRIPNFIAASATPSQWELSQAKESAGAGSGGQGVVEQLLRPTGIPDPEIEIKPVKNQVADVIEEIVKVAAKGQRVLVTTLTKKTAEDLSEYLGEKGIKVSYLHSDVETLERTNILDNLRLGKYDCLVGVNLLREGLDLPEVSLVAILDADKEGFLRSEVSLVQTMGRAARHVEGRVILYADRITNSMQRAMDEIQRRREFQLAMNKKYNITPTSIQKPVRERIIEFDDEGAIDKVIAKIDAGFSHLPDISSDNLTPMDKKKLVKVLRKEMRLAAQDLNFELAAQIRDRIIELDVK